MGGAQQTGGSQETKRRAAGGRRAAGDGAWQGLSGSPLRPYPLRRLTPNPLTLHPSSIQGVDHLLAELVERLELAGLGFGLERLDGEVELVDFTLLP